MPIENLYTKRKNVVLGLIIALGLFLAYALSNIATAIFGTIVIYTLFKPLYQYLVEKKRWHKALSAILIILISFLIIILPLFALAWLIVNKIIYFKNNPEEVNQIINQISNSIGINLNKPEAVENILSTLERGAMGTFSSVVNGVLNAFLQIAIMYFILYFMFVHYKKFEAVLLKYLPFKKTNVSQFAIELKNITNSNVVGQGIISLAQGLCITIGFLIFGLQDAIFWGVICIFLSFLPVLGPALVFIPASIIELTKGNAISGIGIALWGILIVSTIDNVLRLVLAKKLGNVHPIITIIGIVIGIPFFGILGIVIGPLLLSYFILLVKVYETTYIHKPVEEKGDVNIML